MRAGYFEGCRIVRIVALSVALFCAILAGAVAAQAGGRVALVIGNSAYQHTRSLPNPKNDAEAIAKLLGAHDFEVALKLDLLSRHARGCPAVWPDRS